MRNASSLTSFEAPACEVGHGVTYYAVDHSPSYLCNAATHEISAALRPYSGTVLAREEAWQQNPTIHQAIEIKNGVILNPKILSFQTRATEYPHPVLDQRP